MKWFAYIKYFAYLAWNWNIPIAWRIIREEIRGEKKYGIQSTGADELESLGELGIDTEHATIYMPVSYKLLEEIFGQLNSVREPIPFTHFIDIGCGKGRALCVAAAFGFQKLTGIDFSKELCDAANQNLAVTQHQFPNLRYKIINNDAFYFEIPADADCIFLFNPFDEVILGGVVENIQKSMQANPRLLRILYVNPLHKELFLAAGCTEIWHVQKMKYLEASILAWP